jgi:hypothetical protein
MGKNPWDSTGQLQLGTTETIIDPTTGKKRLNLCMGNFASRCNLRIIENPSTAVSKMVLSIFTREGFIARKQYLYPSG